MGGAPGRTEASLTRGAAEQAGRSGRKPDRRCLRLLHGALLLTASCHPLFGPGTIDYSRPDLTDRGPPLHDTTLQHQDEAPAFRRGDGGTE